MRPQRPRPAAPQKRRLLFLAGLLTLLLPLLRFTGFRLPKQPKVVEVKATLIPGGHYLAPDFILFQDDEQPWALSRTCTHLGCKLNFREEERLLECPCHQSRFDLSGQVVNGPAKRPLPSHQVERLADDTYLVTIKA